MKLNKNLLSMLGAVATVATGCVSAPPEYKVVERVTKDGTVEKCVVEKNWQDKMNDSADNNRGLLRYTEVGAQVLGSGSQLWQAINGTVLNGRISDLNDTINNNGRSVTTSINNNTKATKDQTSTFSKLLNAGATLCQ